MPPKNVLIHTLGCRLNAADSALLVSRLETAGWTPVPEDGPEPGLIVINSCSVTAEASRKSRQTARKFRTLYPAAVIVVTGCSAELDRAKYLADGAADLVLTNPEKRDIVPLVAALREHRSTGGGQKFSPDQPTGSFVEQATGLFPFRSRAFLKIQEGCNNFCSYCIVPYVRGRERSRDFDEVI